MEGKSWSDIAKHSAMIILTGVSVCWCFITSTVQHRV